MSAALKWMPLYVDELETDERVGMMDLEEFGLFMRLLIWQWREGSIPSDRKQIAKRLHCGRTAPIVQVLERHFRDDGTGTGRLVNAKLAQVYADQLGKSDKARRAALIRHRGRSASAGADAIRTEARRSLSASQKEIPEGEGDIRRRELPLRIPERQLGT